MKTILLTILLFTNVCYAQDTTDFHSSVWSKTYPCEVGEIQEQEDKFTGEKHYTSQLIYQRTGSNISMMFIKEKKKTKLLLSVIGNTLNVNEQGAILLFENGQKISRPLAKIEVSGEIEGYEYSTQIILTQADIELLKTQLLTDFRLYIYDAHLKQVQQEKVRNYMICISQK